MTFFAEQEKRIFFLGAQPGDKNYLQTNGVFLC
jgi:siroheme synthase